MIKSLCAAAALATFASVATAAPVDVNFNAYQGSTLLFTGDFIGSDANHDGVLSLSELTSFSFSGQGYSASLGNLNSFGSYHIPTNLWSSDAEAWGQFATGAFFSFNHDSLALTSINGFSVTTTPVSVVPEPATLAMMGLGALALAARRKRKSA